MKLYKAQLASVSVYPDPDLQSLSKALIAPDDKVEVLMQLGDWAKMAVRNPDDPARSGWVVMKQLVEVEDEDRREVQLFSDPGADEPQTVFGHVEALKRLENWEKVTVDAGDGHLLTGWIKSSPTTPADSAGSTTSSSSNLKLGKNEEFREHLLRAYTITNIDPAALAALIDAEAAEVTSGPDKGKWNKDSFNGASGAAGLTQFLASTWRDHARKPTTVLNAVAKEKRFVTAGNAISSGKDAELLQLRFDPELSIISAAEFGLACSSHQAP